MEAQQTAVNAGCSSVQRHVSTCKPSPAHAQQEKRRTPSPHLQQAPVGEALLLHRPLVAWPSAKQLAERRQHGGRPRLKVEDHLQGGGKWTESGKPQIRDCTGSSKMGLRQPSSSCMAGIQSVRCVAATLTRRCLLAHHQLCCDSTWRRGSPAA